jgi:GNAT superfamily N-acetyltransferase
MTNGLPPLAPDLRFEPLMDCAEAFEFSFAVKKEALGPHIRARWPWDEDYQRRFHKSRFAEKPFSAIYYHDTAIGTVSWLVESDHARFGEFYLLSRFQNAGIGSRILKHALAHADELGLPVRLEFLKWNPVGSLYLRNGFQPTHESDIHIFLERPPSDKT